MRPPRSSRRPPATVRLALVLALAAGFACRDQTPQTGSATSQPAGGESISAWKPVFRGVEICQAATRQPRPMQIRAARVDLREPTIDLLVTPSNGDEPEECAARSPSEFLAEFHCQVAINGSVFQPRADGPGTPQDVRGLALSRGNLYSRPNQYDALLITRDRRARIARPPFDLTNVYNGLSGFYALLLDGENNATDSEPDPRSAVGISEDGRYLILMTIDGRQIGYSEGATTAETAEWIRKLGAHNALNLDGGASTALVIEGPDGKPQILNRPSGKYERRVANHLGVFSQPLPAKR